MPRETKSISAVAELAQGGIQSLAPLRDQPLSSGRCSWCGGGGAGTKPEHSWRQEAGGSQVERSRWSRKS